MNLYNQQIIYETHLNTLFKLLKTVISVKILCRVAICSKDTIESFRVTKPPTVKLAAQTNTPLMQQQGTLMAIELCVVRWEIRKMLELVEHRKLQK